MDDCLFALKACHLEVEFGRMVIAEGVGTHEPSKDNFEGALTKEMGFQGDIFPGPSLWPYRLATERHHEEGPTHTPDNPPLPQENLSRGPGSVTEPSGSPTCEEIRSA